MVEWPELLQDYLTDEPALNLRFTTVSENQRLLVLETESSEFDILFNTMEQQISFDQLSDNSLSGNSA
jgi:tRNA A37 threonylcarbamoyladenosine biosynthesis protein TsaE